MKSALLRLGMAGLLAFAAARCASPAPSSDPASEDVGVSADAITAADAIGRAEEWVAAKLLYCQSPNGADDTIDPACPPVCVRQSDPAWDPYRSDCSGLVSWAWGLPPPGRTTAGFAPNQTDVTSVINAASLQMGDAVNTDDSVSSEHHVMLFKAWTIPGQQATFIEEPGCSATPNYAHEFTSDVTLDGTSITVAYNGITFEAIRYGALGSTSSSSSSSGAPPPTCHVDGVDGICIDTSVCATCRATSRRPATARVPSASSAARRREAPAPAPPAPAAPAPVAAAPAPAAAPAAGARAGAARARRAATAAPRTARSIRTAVAKPASQRPPPPAPSAFSPGSSCCDAGGGRARRPARGLESPSDYVVFDGGARGSALVSAR